MPVFLVLWLAAADLGVTTDPVHKARADLIAAEHDHDLIAVVAAQLDLDLALLERTLWIIVGLRVPVETDM